MSDTLRWSENLIAATLARVVFQHKHLVIVPNCSWPGSECDLLVVTPNLRVIDVEIKISRADLKADARRTSGITHGIGAQTAAMTRRYANRANGRAASGSTTTACRVRYGTHSCLTACRRRPLASC